MGCASCTPLYCPGALRPRQACSQSSYLTLSGCQLLSLGGHGPCVRLARHRRRRQALRRKRCTAGPLFTRPAWPRSALRSHDYQRAPRKLSVPPTILSRRYAPAASVQSSYLTLSGCRLLSQGRPGVRHQRRRQPLRRQRCTARLIGGCDKHCEYNDAQPDRFSHARRDRDVLYARTIVSAHYAS
jgi:hypothetical protein